jgi:glucose uptake protein
MLVPASSTGVLLALILALLGLGCWMIPYKSANKARFEFLVYDFGWGLALIAVIAAFTLGSWNSSELTFQDNLLLTGMRKPAFGVVAGAAFAIANVLLLASTAVSGMAISFPIAFSFGVAANAIYEYFTRSRLNPTMIFGGAFVLLVAAVLAHIGYSFFLASDHDEETAARTRHSSAFKALLLALGSGLALAIAWVMLNDTISDENGVASYGALLMVAGGFFATSIIVVPFFLNFPVRGKALSVLQYFKIEIGHHLVGLLAGMIWGAGLLAFLVTYGLPPAIQPSAVVVTLLSRGAPLVAGLLGIFAFGELRGAPNRSTMLVLASLVAFAVGLGMLANAPIPR